MKYIFIVDCDYGEGLGTSGPKSVVLVFTGVYVLALIRFRA